jgi:hypothetical protein
MAEKDATEWEWSHWAGTVAQLVEAARLSMEKVRALAPYPEGYDPEAPGYDREKHRAWDKAKAAHRLSVSVAEKDGYSSDLRDLTELADMPERSLGKIEHIWVTVGDGPYLPPSVNMSASRHGGLSVKINGYERTWTAGLRHELEHILRPARRLYAPLFGSDVATFFAGTVAVNFVLYGVAGLLTATTDWGRLTRAFVGLGCAVVVGLAIAAVWFASSAKLELLRPGQEPRYQRWRGKLLAAVSAVILSVIASVIYAVLST